jgi:thioredoxin-related protein
MKKTILLLLVLIISTMSFAKNPRWNKFDDGMKLAKQSGKKILVDVYTDWCSWCKTMDAKTYSDKNVVDYLEKNFVIIKLNAEAKEIITYSGHQISPADFAQGMSLTGYPSTVFLKSNGEAITMLPGYIEPGKFIHMLRFIAENHYEKKKFPDYLQEKGIKP